jgi:hypothetical protein
MNLLKLFAGFGVALAIGAAAPLTYAQIAEPAVPNGTTSIAPAATSPLVPGDKAAPGAPGSGISPKSPAAEMASGSAAADVLNTQYVHKKIDQAQAQGRDVSAARVQERMGNAALRQGKKDKAAEHFETALRSVGQMPEPALRHRAESKVPVQTTSGAID